jgi:hypothetical protein
VTRARNDLLVGQLEVVELIGLVAGQLALAHEQHLGFDEAALAIEPEDVLIAALVRHACWRSWVRLDGAQPIADARRFLEALALGRLVHLPAQLAIELDVLAREQHHRCAQMRFVLGPIDGSTQGPRQRLIWYSRHGRERFLNTLSLQVRSGMVLRTVSSVSRTLYAEW